MHTIVVTAQSFSRHETLCAELEALALEHEFRVIHASFDSLCHDDQVRILKPAKVWVVGKGSECISRKGNTTSASERVFMAALEPQ